MSKYSINQTSSVLDGNCVLLVFLKGFTGILAGKTNPPLGIVVSNFSFFWIFFWFFLIFSTKTKKEDKIQEKSGLSCVHRCKRERQSAEMRCKSSTITRFTRFSLLWSSTTWNSSNSPILLHFVPSSRTILKGHERASEYKTSMFPVFTQKGRKPNKKL